MSFTWGTYDIETHAYGRQLTVQLVLLRNAPLLHHQVDPLLEVHLQFLSALFDVQLDPLYLLLDLLQLSEVTLVYILLVGYLLGQFLLLLTHPPF